VNVECDDAQQVFCKILRNFSHATCKTDENHEKRTIFNFAKT